MGTIYKLLALASIITLLIVAMLIAVNLESVKLIGVHTERFVAKTLDLALYCMSGIGVLGGVIGLTFVGVTIAKRRNEDMRQRDGSFPLQRIKIGGATVYLDVNKTLAPALVVSQHGIAEVFTASPEMHLQHAIARSRVSVAQALAPGDNAIASRFGSQFRVGGRASVDRHLIDGKVKELAQMAPPPAQPEPTPEPPAVQRIRLSDAMNRCTPTQLIAGQADNGDLAVLDLRSSIHGGIVGASGTGKTTSIGYGIVAQALRTGYHVVILDPKGGADWQPWASRAEWHESAPDVFPRQVEALWAEHERRMSLVKAAGVRTVDEIGGVPHTMIVIEEYGDLISQLRRGDKRTADATDNTLDRLMRLSRASGMHLLMIDQYPEEWSQQVIGNTKWLAVFRLGPNQGAKVRQYNADRLPDNGRFIVREREYNAWFAAPYLEKMLPFVPASQAPRVIDGVYKVVSDSVSQGVSQNVSPEVDPPLPEAGNTANKWDDFILEYMSHHAELWQSPPKGVRELARAMSRHETGNDAAEDSFVGIASKTVKRFRDNAMLLGGAKFGTDTSCLL